jgi:hypothetical protein
MRVAMVMGAWTIGSLLLGLLLGRLFGMFAARRRAEQELFSWMESARLMAALRRRARGLSKGIRRVPGSLNPTSTSEVDYQEWLSQWEAQKHGRMVQ